MPYRKGDNEMLDSPAGLPTPPDLVHQPTPSISAAPSAAASSNPVLISAQDVVFSTAAAVGWHRENIGARLVAITRRMFATSTSDDENAARPRPRPKRDRAYLENARMQREMDRL
jgi:hypothetical protein